MKKILCTLLSAIMAFSALTFAVPTVASAAESQESVSETYGDFEYQIYDSSVTITKYTGSAESVTIPSKIAGYKVTEIFEWAFSDSTKLKSVSIPNSVTDIGWGAFENCTSLSSVEIKSSDSISTHIYDRAFYGCKSLKSIVIPGNIEFMWVGGGCAFGECTSLKNVVIQNGVTSLTGFLLYRCTSLESITIPSSVKEIDPGFIVFSGTNITINGYKGTAAETYAKDNSFKFVSLDKTVATAVKLNLAKATLNVGQSATLKATVSPAKADQKCTWTTSNAKIATVDKNGKVVAKGAGTATITAKTANGKIAACKITVNPAPISVKINAKTATVGAGQSVTLKATVSPSKASQKCTWATSNKKVATVTSGGKVVAKGVGTATITVKTYNGKKATCKITVKKAPKSVKLSKTAITLTKGKTYTLKATLSSGSAGSTAWSTSNKKVTTVSSKGVVTAKAKGTAYITVKTYNGKTAKCKVVVK